VFDLTLTLQSSIINVTKRLEFSPCAVCNECQYCEF